VSYRYWINPVLSGLLCLSPLAVVGMATGLPAEAVTAAQDAAQQHFQQGRRHYSKGNYKAAIEQYSTAIKLDSEFVNAYVARGGALGALEEYPAAIEDYTAAINLDPELAGAYGGRGLARFRNGDEAGIEDLWQAAQMYRAQEKMNAYFRTLSIIQRLDP